MVPPQLELLLQRAIQAFQNNSFNEAEVILKNILRIDKYNPAALQILGLTMAVQKRYKDAIKCFEKAIQIFPNDASIHYNLAKALMDDDQDKKALAHHKKINELDPKNFQALVNYGKSLFKLGEYEKALEKFSLAINLNPHYYEAFFNKAITLFKLNEIQEALLCLDQALIIDPKSCDCNFYKGVIYLELNSFEEAISYFQKSIGICPDHYEALSKITYALFKQKKYDQAFTFCNQALKIKPDSHEVFNNKGLIHHELRQYEKAIECFDKAISAMPDYSEAWLNKGFTLISVKRYYEAIEFIDQSIHLKPNFPLALIIKGNALLGLNNFQEAIRFYDQAITLNASVPGAFVNKGIALQAMCKHHEAIHCFDKAIQIDETFPEAWLNKGSSLNEIKNHELAAKCFFQSHKHNKDNFFSLGRAHHQMMLMCDWTNYKEITKEIFSKLNDGKEVAEPFALQGICDSEHLLRKCAEIFTRNQFPNQFFSYNKSKYSHKKIRLGYLCGEFRTQATSILMIGAWENHDKELFELYAFDNGLNDHSAMRTRIENAFSKIIDISNLSDEDAARLIQSSEIDILINLNGFYGRHRLGIFSYRPAPVQVNYLGFPGTIGTNYIDYLIADKVVIPEKSMDFYNENIIYLPNSYQANDDKREISERKFSRAELGLPEKGFVFACFNNNYKLSPSTFDSWAKILSSVDNSVLWILKDNPWVENNLPKELAIRGVNPSKLVFADRLSNADHLSRHAQADLFLDTWPYNAHTTASDALWSGLPVLTLMGNAFPGRVAASLLKAIDLPDLVAYSINEYELMAIELARNHEKLRSIKDRLVKNRLSSPLFNTKLFTRNLEAAYLGMHDFYQKDIAPRSFSVLQK